MNKNASEKDKQATFDFIEWLFSSDEGKKVMSQDMGFAVPSTAYGDKDQPDNPLTAAARKYETNGVPMVRSFSTLDAWGADVQDALVEYVNQTGKWDAVADAYTNGWAKGVEDLRGHQRCAAGGHHVEWRRAVNRSPPHPRSGDVSSLRPRFPYSAPIRRRPAESRWWIG